MSEHQNIECDDCRATPETGDSHVITVRQDEATDTWHTAVTWHTADCPQHTVDRILLEDNARRLRERKAWAREAFPAAHERLKEAAAALPADGAAAPFVAALTELAEAQGRDLGGLVMADQWAEILERHFPPPGVPFDPQEKTT